MVLTLLEFPSDVRSRLTNKVLVKQRLSPGKEGSILVNIWKASTSESWNKARFSPVLGYFLFIVDWFDYPFFHLFN